jgi:hypothetical protein
MAKSTSQVRRAQYMTREATTWSPGSSAWNTAVAAAMPEANSRQSRPPSSRARSSSGSS